MFAVQKNPIKVIEIKDGDNINNYSELVYRKLDTVTVGVSDKYLKWENGDADNGALLEMTNDEKVVIVETEMSTWKAETKLAVVTNGKALITAKYPQLDKDAFITGLYPTELTNAVKADMVNVYQQVQAIKANIDSATLSTKDSVSLVITL